LDIWCLFTSACAKSSFERGRGRLYKIHMTISYFTPSRWASTALLGLLTFSPIGASAGMTPDEVKKFEDYKAKAATGDAGAQSMVGLCYALELGVKQDMFQAFNWYRKSAEQGHAEGLHQAGLCYSKGWGVAKSGVEAYAYISLAAATNELARDNLASLETSISSAEVEAGKKRAVELQREIKSKMAPKRGSSRRDKTDFLEPPIIDSSNPDGAAERFLERMSQKHGRSKEIGGKTYVFIDNSFPLCRTFRKGYYRIDNISVTDKLEMLDIIIQMAKHMEKLDEIMKGPDDEESLKRGMLMMNQWADDGRNLEKRLFSILGVN